MEYVTEKEREEEQIVTFRLAGRSFMNIRNNNNAISSPRGLILRFLIKFRVVIDTARFWVSDTLSNEKLIYF